MGIGKARDDADELTALLLEIRQAIRDVAISADAGYSKLTRQAAESLIAADNAAQQAQLIAHGQRERIEREIETWKQKRGER